jgi:death-on-curing protein
VDDEILYFDIKHAVEVHDYILEVSGGLHGYRDIGLLESVLDHIQSYSRKWCTGGIVMMS